MSKDSFIHLRVHSSYSLSEGASSLGELLAAAQEANLPAIGLADRGNMFGALSFSEYAMKKKIQPIIGCQMELAFAERKSGNIVLIAKNEAGYKNLCRLLTLASRSLPQEDGDGNVKRAIAPNDLEAHADGLILLTGGGEGGLLPMLVEHNKDWAREQCRWFLQVFSDRVYVEICRNSAPSGSRSSTEETLLAMAMGDIDPVMCGDGVVRSELPIVGTSDVWYADKARHEAWLLLDAVAKKHSIIFDGGKAVKTTEVYHDLKSSDEMADIFADLPEAYENTSNIARRCSFFVRSRQPMLPRFPAAAGKSEAEMLREQASAGLESRLAEIDMPPGEKDLRRERLKYELDVIERMGFPGYFLIVGDFISWAKSRDIPVGPGRGSGAGSIVAWALRITELDPLRFGLLFERFLNPERVSMPDFDIDFCQDRRDLVRQYVVEKYGEDRVALIATFGIIKSKTALTDISRVVNDESLGTVGFNEIKEVTKIIPNKENAAEPVSLSDAFEHSEAFRRKITSSEALKNVFDKAKEIEGLIRTSGSHAAGLVIGAEPLTELIPLSYDAEAKMNVSGFDMKGVEKSGLVKFDFLGLTTLSVLKKACNSLKKNDIDIDLNNLPLDDPEVYEMLSRGQTAGVFQFEGAGMRAVLRKMKPSRFEDLIAVAALFRPGPMAYIANYIDRKNGHEHFEYPGDPQKTKPILEETYGIMVYQEQVMQVAQACAGYSLGGADLLRRAMGKKIQEEMDKQRKVFVHGDASAKPPVPGAVAMGMSEADANRLFDDIVPFAGYGFNKSHAAAYALIGYQTAYLKCHYPAEFMAALMSYFGGKPERLMLIRDDLDESKIPILPPSVNSSGDDFLPEGSRPGVGGNAVRFGLGAITQIGAAGAAIYLERLRAGPYASLQDFAIRVGTKVNRSQILKLAEIGAFDDLWPNRRQAGDIVSWLVSSAQKSDPRQMSFFSGAESIIIPKKFLQTPEWENLNDRKFGAAGFYFDWHPLDDMKPMMIRGGIKRKKSLLEWMQKTKTEEVRNKKLCGFVEKCFMQQTRNGNPYLLIFINERSDSYRVSYYGGRNSEDEMYRVMNLIEEAKLSKSPLVLNCTLNLNREGDDVWVNARDVMLAEKYFASLDSDVLVRLNTSSILFNREESKLIREAGCDLSDAAAGLQTPAIAKAREMAARRVLAQITALLKEASKGADLGRPVKVTIEGQLGDGSTLCESGVYPLPREGRIYNEIKQIDGVVAIESSFDAAPVADEAHRLGMVA